MSSLRIGRVLGISARTVNDHVDIMMRRAGAANRVELIARAYASGILLCGTWPPLSSPNRCLQRLDVNGGQDQALALANK
jgi:hypothetical protein